MVFKAFAKINLAIDVLDKREDGYHNIDLICVPVELHDFVEIEEYKSKYGTYVTSDDPGLICDESNLVYVAYRAMKKEYNFDSGLRIHIHKKIPTMAGLAGGSADAAAVINGLKKMKKLNITDEKMIEIASSIGSDVPYCLFNKAARVQGKGEKLTPIKLKEAYYVLLVKPQQGLSTKDVYIQSDSCYKDKPNIKELIEGLEEGDEEKIKANMKNGLQHAAIELLPEIGELISRLNAEGLEMTMMSGSGSSVFSLSKNLKLLQKIASKFKNEGYDVFVPRMIKWLIND